MTPKEKAIELVDRYYSLFSLEFENTIDITQAKKCALIAVDEILHNDGFTQFDQYLTEYWQEVKQEIEKL
jgi:hypothetical protein